MFLMGFVLAVWTGLEPATPCVTGRYSNQLNYQTVFRFSSLFCDAGANVYPFFNFDKADCQKI